MKKTSRAGVSDTRAGLQPAGLFSNAGIFKKGFQDFHPLDESPYLLFDAESSMLGNLENPSLDLDASKAETLDVITATRAGIATYTAADGQIVVADENTVRVDWSLGYPAMLIEPSATNLLPYSASLYQWSNARTTKTLNATVSPDGETNGTYLEQDAGETNAGSVYKTFSSVTGEYTLSVYAKKKEKNFVVLYDTNTNRTYFNLEAGTVGTTPSGNTAKIEDVGNGWFRCSTTFTASSGGVSAFYLGDTDNSSVVTGSGGIYLWGAQLEAGSVATSYIPTSGSAVTRNADNLVIDGTAFSDFYNATEGTFYVELQSKAETNTQPHYIDVTDSAFINRITLYVSGVNRLFVNTNGTVVVNNLGIGNYTQNELQRIAASYKVNNFKGSTNGSAEATDTSGNVPVNQNKLFLGQRFNTAYNMNGHIKRLIYWPTHSDSL